MATQTMLVDDIDGTEATETVEFGLFGTTYEIDLSTANLEDLKTALKAYMENARKVGPRRKTTSTTSPRRERRKKDSEGSKAREWAREQGIEVPERGRLPVDVLEKYRAAHSRSDDSQGEPGQPVVEEPAHQPIAELTEHEVEDDRLLDDYATNQDSEEYDDNGWDDEE